MRYIGALVRLVRERGKTFDGTVDSTTGIVTSGVSNELVLQFFNEAQDALQARIAKVFPNYFYATKIINLVGGQEAYSISDALLNDSKIVQVEYSFDGSLQAYRPLRQRSLYERNSDSFTEPLYYILFNNQILLNPIPATSGFSSIRVTYYRSLDDLALRSGVVASRTIVGNDLSALALSTTGDDPTALNLGASEQPYICFNDNFGNVTARNITYSAYDSGTGIVTLSPNPFVLQSNETVPVGSFATVGQYTTTHSKLPNDCERYLIVFATKRLLNQNSSVDEVAEDAELVAIEDDIISNFAPVSGDVQSIPIIDPYVGEQ